jgi:hypothetical protein
MATSAVFADGLITVFNTATPYLTYTNSSSYNSSLNGIYDTTQGKAASAANGFYYALLFQPYNAGLANINPLDPNYVVGMMATNLGPAGGIIGSGSVAGAAITGWDAPTGPTYDTSERNNFLLVGWSANLGATWSAISLQLQTGNWNVPIGQTGFFWRFCAG